MTRIGWVLKVGAIAIGLATVSLPLGAAAQSAKPDTIVLASASQPVLQRAMKGATTTVSAGSGSAPTVTPETSAVPVFVPRIRRGVPASRVGGATRGPRNEITIQTLVPEIDEAALTMAAQPNLHWHLSAETPHPVNFTLIDPDAIEPMVDIMIPGPLQAGFHVLSLADHEAQLKLGRHYEWFVALVPSPENRSADTVARGAIQRVHDPGLASRVAEAEPAAVVGLLAESGIWYEALDTLSQRVRQSPDEPGWRVRRTAILEQVGLVISDGR